MKFCESRRYVPHASSPMGTRTIHEHVLIGKSPDTASIGAFFYIGQLNSFPPIFVIARFLPGFALKKLFKDIFQMFLKSIHSFKIDTFTNV